MHEYRNSIGLSGMCCASLPVVLNMPGHYDVEWSWSNLWMWVHSVDNYSECYIIVCVLYLLHEWTSSACEEVCRYMCSRADTGGFNRKRTRTPSSDYRWSCDLSPRHVLKIVWSLFTPCAEKNLGAVCGSLVSVCLSDAEESNVEWEQRIGHYLQPLLTL